MPHHSETLFGPSPFDSHPAILSIEMPNQGSGPTFDREWVKTSATERQLIQDLFQGKTWLELAGGLSISQIAYGPLEGSRRSTVFRRPIVSIIGWGDQVEITWGPDLTAIDYSEIWAVGNHKSAPETIHFSALTGLESFGKPSFQSQIAHKKPYIWNYPLSDTSTTYLLIGGHHGDSQEGRAATAALAMNPSGVKLLNLQAECGGPISVCKLQFSPKF